ncbi:MAG: AAA family ATPase [Candidatus Krumholzibacteriia bacterium]
MRVLEAYIRGFGRLAERHFRFSPGAQLIVGENEAGKSTLQQFILGMLFGLKREDRKRREYLPQYEIYRPWSDAPYEGRLVYELSNGERFELHRVFERDRESLCILDALTGRDRTSEFPVDSRKERTLMQAQLHLTRRLFEATTSLGQLAGRPTAEGVGALRERVQGLLDSGDEAVSASDALEALRRLRDGFGTERTPTRGAGLLLRQKQLLHSELDAARRRHAEILELHERRVRAIAAHAQADAAWRRCRSAELERERQELSRRVQQAETLGQRLEAARRRVDSYDDVADLEVAAYAPARERAASIAALERDVRDRGGRLELARRRDAQTSELEERLETALGRMDRSSAQALTVQAERLRERIGSVREARRRHVAEQEHNKALIEALRRPLGRDGTRDEFMGRLRAEQAAAADTQAAPLQEEARSRAQAHRRHRRAALFGVASGTFGVVVLAGLAWWSPTGFPLVARVALPVVGALLGIAFLQSTLRRLAAERHDVRALESRVAHLVVRKREAERWLEEVLRRNELDGVESLHASRREYESLRAHAERTAAASPMRELVELERQLVELAGALHAQVARCDLVTLRALLARPPEPARDLLPYAEEAADETPQPGDPAEIGRLVRDLGLLPELRRGFEWRERIREHRRRVGEFLSEQTRELEARVATLDGEKAGLDAVLRRNGARSLEEFAARVERHRERDVALAEYVPLRREQAGVLGADNLDALRARMAALAAEGQSHAPAAAGGAVALEARGAEVATGTGASLEELGREVERLAAERAQLEERLAAREREGRTPAEVELEIHEVESRLAEARRRDAALELAADTLGQVASELHRHVAPRMNLRVGEIFARLSRGQHTEVRLDEDLTLRVRMDGGAVHGTESLSGGAADQLYFALRVTAGEQLAQGGERLPLLLDDPFVQYDPERLRAALDLVAELTQEHQVFLFTCEAAQAAALEERVRTRDIQYDTVHL